MFAVAGREVQVGLRKRSVPVPWTNVTQTNLILPGRLQKTYAVRSITLVPL